MELQIWKGKKAKYNRLVLEALSYGGKTSWEIAKYIVEHDPNHARGNWYHQAQKVNSRLLRRGGILDDLADSEFIKRGEDKKYSLTILGLSYVLYQINHSGWKLDKDKLFLIYWSSLAGTMVKEFEENFDQYSPIEKLTSQCLAEVFKAYPEKPPIWIQTFWDEMSKSAWRRLIEYLTLGEDLNKLSQREINSWVLEGVYEACKKSFRWPPSRESEQLMSLMCNSFQKLPEEDKLMVIQSFKTMLHEIIYRIARENQFLKKAFIEKVRQAEPHQIVCYVKCPHCNYNGFSLQNGYKLLSTKFSVLCEKCKNKSAFTSVSE